MDSADRKANPGLVANAMFASPPEKFSSPGDSPAAITTIDTRYACFDDNINISSAAITPRVTRASSTIGTARTCFVAVPAVPTSHFIQ